MGHVATAGVGRKTGHPPPRHARSRAALGLVALAVFALYSPAAAQPLVLELLPNDDLDPDRTLLTRALVDELGRTVTGSDVANAPRLVVRVEGTVAWVEWHPVGGPVVTRELALVAAQPEHWPRMVAALAGNLVRDQVSSLLGDIGAAQPPPAPPTTVTITEPESRESQGSRIEPPHDTRPAGLGAEATRHADRTAEAARAWEGWAVAVDAGLGFQPVVRWFDLALSIHHGWRHVALTIIGESGWGGEVLHQDPFDASSVPFRRYAVAARVAGRLPIDRWLLSLGAGLGASITRTFGDNDLGPLAQGFVGFAYRATSWLAITVEGLVSLRAPARFRGSTALSGGVRLGLRMGSS